VVPVPSADPVPLPPAAEQDLVRALAASVVGDLSPDELDVFDETAEEFFADPDEVLRAGDKDEAVGFGLELALITPVVLAVVTSVVRFLASLLADAMKETARPALVRTLRRILRIREDGATAQAAAVPLDVDQLRRVHEVAMNRAMSLGLPEDRARLLADSIAGGIVVA
jgi:hypothetical protein